MKLLYLIPVLLLTACASRTPKKHAIIAIAPVPSRSVNATSLRTDEQLREYRFGRYVDPADALAMHEGHPVYRVETTAQWNLRPGSGTSPRPRLGVAEPSVSSNDAVVAEVNKQRVATRTFTEQTATLNQRLGEMKEATAQTREIAKQTATLTREVTALRERIEAAESQASERKPAAPSQPPRTEDKW